MLKRAPAEAVIRSNKMPLSARHFAALCALATLSACASPLPESPLFGDWSMELPTTPRMHGNEVSFRANCVIARGNLVDSRVVQPARFHIEDAAIYVWYGPATELQALYLEKAARVTFVAPNRIEVAWPEGFSASYRRAIFSSTSNRDCRTR